MPESYIALLVDVSEGLISLAVGYMCDLSLSHNEVEKSSLRVIPDLD